ncbi:MAG TPA: outer membrane lipoprotein carrier protein LolA [Edaphobacter sp.]|nr:outer membrane lipoprotein carrier protein LolA [Edaphobacter sp.]
MLRRVVLLAGVLLVPMFAQAQNADALLRRVDEHYNRLISLQARYTEHYMGMGLDRTESGTLLLKKPGRMRWSYDQPEGKVFVLDGKFAWFYTPGDAQAQRLPAKQLDDLRSPLRFLLGRTQLKKELGSLAITNDTHGIHIAGVPLGMEQRVRRLTLDVTSAGEIQHMKIEEIDGATTEFVFTQVKENIPTREADFVFSPPAGVTVVEALPPV